LGFSVAWISEQGYDTGADNNPSSQIRTVLRMNAAQCRMARAATGMGVRDLAKAASVSPDTVARLERGEDLRPATVDSIRAALEAAGVVFLPENGNGPGVALRKG
jgi:DNA-binding XRE family transcriptional regulator